MLGIWTDAEFILSFQFDSTWKSMNNFLRRNLLRIQQSVTSPAQREGLFWSMRHETYEICGTNFMTKSICLCVCVIIQLGFHSHANPMWLMLFNEGENLHLFSMNWWRRQDFPVPALPITRNLNRKSESRGEELEINATPTSGKNPQRQSSDFFLILLSFYFHSIQQPEISLLIIKPCM